MMMRLHQLLQLNSTRQALSAFLIGLFLLITYLMLIELPPKNAGWPHWDKVQHILVFLMLTGLTLCLYFKQRWQWAIGLSLYGACIEWMQATFTLTRMASLGDWLADVAGILLAIAISVAINKQCMRNTVELSAS